MYNFFKKDKHSIIVAFIALLITLFICIAYFLPINLGGVLQTVSQPIETLNQADIDAMNGCWFDKTNKYIVDGVDPQMVFNIDNKELECAKINLSAASPGSALIELYVAGEGQEFSAERCFWGSVNKGEQYAVIDIPNGEYTNLRFDINLGDLYIKNIELHSEQPQMVPYTPNYAAIDYVLTVLFPLLVSTVIFFINKKTRFFEKIITAILKNRFKIVKFIAVFVAMAIIAVCAELLINKITQVEFNIYRTIFFVGVAELIVVFVLGYKSLKQQPENLFLPIALIIGLVMLFASPIKHIAWDLDSHYPWAIDSSNLNTSYMTAADLNVDMHNPQSMYYDNFTLEIYENDIEYLTQADKQLVQIHDNDFSIAHLPAGIFIALARFFGAGFAVKYNMGRLAYLLVYSIVCYFAIKKIKSGKMILSTICLFPTCLYIATNYGYDSWVTAFSLLGLSYYTSMLQEPEKPITVKDTLIMCLAFAFSALPKLVYVVLMAIPIFMFKKWNSKQEKRRYYLILISIFVIVFILFLLRSMSSIGGGGDTRGGAVGPVEQIKGILYNPFGYAKILFDFLKEYLSISTMQEYISHFAYLGIGKYWFIIAWVLLITALTDHNPNMKFKIPIFIKVCSVLLYFGMAVLIASALYISFTPVGSTTINGCQPRYIIPLLAPTLLLVTGQRFKLTKNTALYNGCVLGVLTVVVMLETYLQIITKMI